MAYGKMAGVTDDLSLRLVPDELWALARTLLPGFTARPQGGGTAPHDERAVFTAVVYVLTSGCPWRQLPTVFGVSPATTHRRCTAWTRSDLWQRLHAAAAEAGVEPEWTAAIAAAAARRSG
ncbi:transposase [Streptomyces sp. NBC_01283]|uniref:transposase n=1 Tax=Streptomyces sp. NBC_01283 TaxID=2903812 RepID=UPI00352F69B5|nr:transposase [Streptomyces sp. NBC_01283]